jgi:hypothetical protein
MVEKSGELEGTQRAVNDFESENQIEKLTDNEPAEIADEPDAIREQIGETRREMGETLDAIQEKLSFSNISEQVKEQVTEHITDAVETVKTAVWDTTVGKAGKFMKNIGGEIKRSNIGKMASDNPLPVALIGLGIGMLVFNKYKGRSSGTYPNGNSRRAMYGNQPGQPGQSGQMNEQKSGGISQNIGDAANSAYEKAGDMADKVYENTSGAATKVYESVSGAAGTAYNKVGDFGGQLQERYDYYLEENPLVIGAVALALGAAVGAAIPSTRYEGELMGDARESLVSKVQTAAHDAFDKVQEAVGQAKETIIEDAKQVVSQAKDSITGESEAADSARHTTA